MKRLQEKVALITGAGRKKGIGYACALRMAVEGANVVIADMINNDSDKENMLALARELEDEGIKALALHVDVTNEEAVKKMIGSVVKEMGRLDILVNNAGTAGTPSPLAQSELDAWEKTMAINLNGTFLCSREAVPLMVEGGGGKIVNMSSRAAYRGAIWLHAYCTTKAGILGLTRSMSLELAPLNITVNAVCPGHIDTEMKRWGWEQEATIKGNKVEELMDGAAASTPLGRIGTPEDVAATVAFLASDDAGYLTGEAISVTGGDGTRTVL